jgi:hypothetical protein
VQRSPSARGRSSSGEDTAQAIQGAREPRHIHCLLSAGRRARAAGKADMKSLALLARLFPLAGPCVASGRANLVLLIPLVALSACEGGTFVYTVPPPPPPPPVVYDEGEPNDEAWMAPWFGSLYPDESVRVAGFITDDGSDPQDGLAFTAYGPCQIDFTLYVDDPWADLDVWLYEPESGLFTAVFASSCHDERGSIWFDAPSTDFHLVVVSALGASPWTIVVDSAGGSAAPLVVGASGSHDEHARIADAAREARRIATAEPGQALPGSPARSPALPRSLRVYARGVDEDRERADPVLSAGARAWIGPRSVRIQHL